MGRTPALSARARRPGAPAGSALALVLALVPALVLALALALAACTGPTTPPAPPTVPSPTPTPVTPTPVTPTPVTPTPVTPTPVTPASVTVTLDGPSPADPVTLTVSAPADATVTTRAGAEGSTRVIVRGLADGAVVVVRAVGPQGVTFARELDGTLALAAGDATLGGLAAPSGGSAHADGARVTITADGSAVTLWAGAGTPRSATWGTHDGGRSLAVDPNGWARAAGLAGGEATWSALVAEQPDTDRPGMHDQLVCHALGAPDKTTWNLEPWRPDVGLVATIAARCNPS